MGLATGLVLYIAWHLAGGAASDWDQVWYGARALIGGRDPYRELTPTISPWPLIYPLPAVFLAVPFAALPLSVARACWFGASAGCLAYAWASGPQWRLRGLLSGAFLWCAMGANWTPFLVAGLWTPACRFWWCVKPTTGFVMWLRKPSRASVLGVAVLATVSFAIEPRWLREWLGNVLHPDWGFAYHPIPITLPGGWLLLLALLRWRQPEARLLLGWCLVPSSIMPSELLLGFAVARTRREWTVVSLISWLVIAYGVFIGRAAQLPAETPRHAFERWSQHLWPALLAGWLVLLVMVLRQPNANELRSAAESTRDSVA